MVYPWSSAGLRFIVTPEQDYILENNGNKTEINANGALIKKNGVRVPIFI